MVHKNLFSPLEMVAESERGPNRSATELGMRMGVGLEGMRGEERSAVRLLAFLAGEACGFPGNVCCG